MWGGVGGKYLFSLLSPISLTTFFAFSSSVRPSSSHTCRVSCLCDDGGMVDLIFPNMHYFVRSGAQAGNAGKHRGNDR